MERIQSISTVKAVRWDGEGKHRQEAEGDINITPGRNPTEFFFLHRYSKVYQEYSKSAKTCKGLRLEIVTRYPHTSYQE